MFSWLFPSGGESIGASASASGLPVNIHGWFPLGWTGWIPLPSKGLSRVFSRATVWSKWEPDAWNFAHGFLSQVLGQWLGSMAGSSPELETSPGGEGKLVIRTNSIHRAAWWLVGHTALELMGTNIPWRWWWVTVSSRRLRVSHLFPGVHKIRKSGKPVIKQVPWKEVWGACLIRHRPWHSRVGGWLRYPKVQGTPGERRLPEILSFGDSPQR